MTRYKLKELKQTDTIERRIRQKVHQQIKQPQSKRAFHIPILTMITTAAILFIIIQLLAPQATWQTASPSLMNVFHEIDGDGVAYSQDYYQLDHQHTRTLKYYREIPLSTFLHATGRKMIDLPSPFTIEDGTVIAVNDGYLTEIQIHFKHEDEFINISMAKTLMNHLEYSSLAKMKQDAYGTPIELEQLDAETILTKKLLQEGGGLVYSYYHYNEKDDAIYLTGTVANEFYSMADGFIYYIGYSEQNSLTPDQMTKFAKEFVENNTFKTLEFIEPTMEDTWLTRGGKTMLIYLFIAISSFVATHYLMKNRSVKMKKLVWTIIWTFLHAPILSWLISFTVGTLYRDGFAGIGMLIITYPTLLIVGLIFNFAWHRHVTKLFMLLHVFSFIFAFGVSIFYR